MENDNITNQTKGSEEQYNDVFHILANFWVPRKERKNLKKKNNDEQCHTSEIETISWIETAKENDEYTII